MTRGISVLRSIRARIAVVVTFVAIAYSVVIGTIVGEETAQHIEQDRGRLMQQLAFEMVGELDEHMFWDSRQIQNLAATPVMSGADEAASLKRAQLEQFQKSFGEYSWLGIADATGVIRAATGGQWEGVQVAQSAWFQAASKGPYAGEAYDAFTLAGLRSKSFDDPLPLRLVDLAVPIMDAQGHLQGVLSAHMSEEWAEHVAEMLRGQFKGLEGVDAQLFTRDGQLLLGTGLLPQRIPDVEAASVRSARGGGNGYLVEDWPDQQTYISGYAQAKGYLDYPGMGWVMVVRQSTDAAYAAAKGLRNTTIAISALFSIIFGALIFLVVGRLVKPMGVIAAAAHRIRSGETEAKIPLLQGDDEAAHLSEALRSLVDGLAAKKDELQGLNQQLEHDVKRREEVERSLRQSESRLRAVVEHLPAGAVYVEGSAIMFNKAVEQMTGYSRDEINCIDQWFRLLFADRAQEITDHYRKEKAAGFPLPWEVTFLCKDGTPRVAEFAGYGDRRGEIWLMRDVTDRKQSEERIYYLAHYDEITGLPNRAMFSVIAERAIQKSERSGMLLAILFIDLDRFKNINDTLGHAAGDQLLRQVGERLRHCVREPDTLSRQGGDEFVLLIDELASADDAAEIARKMLAVLETPFSLAGGEYILSASIGISIYPGDGTDLQTLLKNADIAMYRAKEHGKNTYQYYSEKLNTLSFERLVLESSLHRALERGEFVLYYQPQLDMRTGEITGLEALLRWQHPELGLIPPVQFISLVEEIGLIVPIGLWVLRTACAQSRHWQNQGLSPVRIAVNLSARQFSDMNLLKAVRDAIEEAAIDPVHLELEITESMVMSNPEQAVELLGQFKAMGLFLAIDDFGIGYSSLSSLKRYPLDYVKVDRSFIKDVPGDPDDVAITRAVVAMAHNLRLKVIAEGVETQEQLRFLRDIACDEMQGYYFNKPLPVDQATELLRSHQPAAWLEEAG